MLVSKSSSDEEQVRQILLHLREEDPERFISEAETILVNPDIRFHIKDTVLAFLRTLPDPTAAEWELIARLIATEPPFTTHLWLSIRTLPWFERLDTEGVIAGWLASNAETDHRHALETMLGAVKERPDLMAELLAPYAGRAADYPAWLAWITRFANVYESRALFDLVLDAIRRGDYQGNEHALWLSLHGLGQRRPSWGAELLAAYLWQIGLRRPSARRPESPCSGPEIDSSTPPSRRTAQSAEGAPEPFCELLLPYMCHVMQLTRGLIAGTSDLRSTFLRSTSHQRPSARPRCRTLSHGERSPLSVQAGHHRG